MPAIFKKYQIILDGRKVSYWQKGENEEKTIVLLHGFPGSHRGLTDMAKGLSGYRIVIPDLPGCGKSEPLKNSYTLKHYAAWLYAFLENLSLKKVILVGHSFGSRIALVFAETYPEKMETMILITPVTAVEGLIARAASIQYKIAELLPSNLKHAWLANGLYQKIEHMIIFKSVRGKRKAELVKKDKTEYRLIDPETTIGVFEEFYRNNLLPKANIATIPTLIIASDKDEIAPLTQVKELTIRLPHSKMIIMKNSGHLVVLERPLQTAKIIREWLDTK